MTKILVTGSNGLLGQKLVASVRNRPEISLMATSRAQNAIASQSGYVFEAMDVMDPTRVAAVLKNYRPDTVINTAAMTEVDACEQERDRCRKLNVEAVHILVRECQKSGTHLIHLSTDFVFDGNAGPYREEDKPNPLSFYAQSKLESEIIVQKGKIPWTLVRTMLLYGVTEKSSRSNIVLWAKKKLENKEKIKVVTDQFRMPTLAEDLAAGCIAAALKKATGIYHISGKDLMSILELVTTVADFFGLDKSLIEPTDSASLNQPAKRPPKTGFILDKAARDLDYHPHSFHEGLVLVKKQLGN